MKKFTIALAQIDSVLGDVNKNVIKHLEFVSKAKERGADLIVFPELSLTGYSIKDLNWDVAISRKNDGIIQTLKDASKDISIVIGGVEESDNFGIYNSAFFLEMGLIAHVHRKVYPPTYGMFEESRYFLPGKVVKPYDSKVGKLGILICEDLWHMSLPYLMALQKVWLIIGMIASPTRLIPGEEKVKIAEVNANNCAAYARLLSSYVVFCNRVGFEDGVNFWGGSFVADPQGEIIAQAKLFEEDIIYADIDPEQVRRSRKFSRHLLDENIDIVTAELRRIRRDIQ
ncbi:MAG: nitrilase-related carbon-nitrogen hydrolase [Bacteroidota bacterium]